MCYTWAINFEQYDKMNSSPSKLLVELKHILYKKNIHMKLIIMFTKYSYMKLH